MSLTPHHWRMARRSEEGEHRLVFEQGGEAQNIDNRHEKAVDLAEADKEHVNLKERVEQLRGKTKDVVDKQKEQMSDLLLKGAGPLNHQMMQQMEDFEKQDPQYKNTAEKDRPALREAYKQKLIERMLQRFNNKQKNIELGLVASYDTQSQGFKLELKQSQQTMGLEKVPAETKKAIEDALNLVNDKNLRNAITKSFANMSPDELKATPDVLVNLKDFTAVDMRKILGYLRMPLDATQQAQLEKQNPDLAQKLRLVSTDPAKSIFLRFGVGAEAVAKEKASEQNSEILRKGQEIVRQHQEKLANITDPNKRIEANEVALAQLQMIGIDVSAGDVILKGGELKVFEPSDPKQQIEVAMNKFMGMLKLIYIKIGILKRDIRRATGQEAKPTGNTPEEMKMSSEMQGEKLLLGAKFKYEQGALVAQRPLGKEEKQMSKVQFQCKDGLWQYRQDNNAWQTIDAGLKLYDIDTKPPSLPKISQNARTELNDLFKQFQSINAVLEKQIAPEAAKAKEDKEKQTAPGEKILTESGFKKMESGEFHLDTTVTSSYKITFKIKYEEGIWKMFQQPGDTVWRPIPLTGAGYAEDAKIPENNANRKMLNEVTKRLGQLNGPNLKAKEEDQKKNDEKEKAAKVEKNAKVKASGEALLKRVDANDNGTYFTKQFGLWTNKFLYTRFEPAQGKWLVGMGSVDDATNDPANYQADMYGGTDKYNQLIRDLDNVNKGLL